ncbi:MAG: hypothetical protein HRF40_08865 [Nitrososphaera sp.]|jgi:hypothetical protein
MPWLHEKIRTISHPKEKQNERPILICECEVDILAPLALNIGVQKKEGRSREPPPFFMK